jgi:signal transduction histidine kinase
VDGVDAVPVRVLHALMTRVHLSSNFQETLDAVTQGVVDVTGFGIAAISVVRDDRLAQMVSVAGPEEASKVLLGTTVPVWDIVPPDQPFEQWGLFRFISHTDFRGWDGPMVLPRISTVAGPDAWPPYDSLVAPLHDAGGELIGFLHVDEPPGGVRPGPGLLHRLDILAVQAGIAVRAQHDRDLLQGQVRLARLGHLLTLAATRASDLTSLAGEVVDLVRDEVRVDRVALRLVDSEAGLPVGLWTTDGTDAIRLPELVRQVAEQIARDAWERREVVAISLDKPDPALAPDVDVKKLAKALLTWGISTVLLAPVGADQVFLGYLVLMRRGEGASWTPAETKAVYESSRDLGTVALNRALLARSRAYVAHLREVDEQKRVMFATVSHEFKGPIAAIAGNAELLEDELATTVSDAATASIEAVARNARRLDDLVADLMVLQEPDDPDRRHPRAPVDLWSAVREAVDVWRVPAGNKQVRLVVEPAEDTVLVVGERADLLRIVVNLVSNAVKYSAAGGTVMLRVEADGDVVRFVCADEGIGIAHDEVGTVFDEFVRGTQAGIRSQPGTGLGLSIVRRLTEELGGTVQVSSVLGEGSTFTVTLPRAPTPPG